MSGIAGVIHFDGQPVAPGVIEAMTDAMVHRGPDGIRHWRQKSVALGHCMLRTTPESLEEQQPLASEDQRFVLVMDGRIDNWEELRRSLLLHGAVLRTQADSELVLRAYQTWGRHCLAHIDGDFAFVLWDANRQAVFCARDRMGNKPFDYHWNGRTLAFASEVHAILSLPWVSAVLNEGMLAETLANERYSREETLWRGIFRLVQANHMVVDAHGPRYTQYWQPNLDATLPHKTEAEYVAHYRELLTDSVRRMSRSQAPVAYEVSGGLDSSALFCVAAHLQCSGDLLAPDLEGYTLAFPPGDTADELEYARAVGEYLGLRLQEVAPTTPSVSWYYERARVEREFPGYPNGTMSLGLQQLARSHGATAIVTGIGGDEWLGDAWGLRPYYADDLAALRLGAILTSVLADYRDFGLARTAKWLLRHGLVGSAPEAARRVLREWLWALRGNRQRTEPWLSAKLSSLLDQRRATHARQSADAARPHRPGVSVKLKSLNDAHTAWAIETEERMSARLGLETRAPLRSPKLVCFSFATPAGMLTRGRRDKYLHRRAIRDLVPDKILNRGDKAEFSCVFTKQLADLGSVCDRISRERADWFGEHGPAELYQAYSQGNFSNLALRRHQVAWWLTSAIGCDGVA